MSFMTPDFQTGYASGWVDFIPGELVGEPVASEDYCFGYWCGIGDAMAFHQGWQAHDNGVFTCPYALGSEDDYLRQSWLDGYWEAQVVAE